MHAAFVLALILSTCVVTSVSVACDACGGSATYSEAISTSGGYQKRTIKSSGCPNHYSYCTGKGSNGVPGCGAIGAEGLMTEATVQAHSIDIPASPVIASESFDLECKPGTIAIALNGVSIYGGWVGGTCDLLDVSDVSGEWTSFDYCSGHPTGGQRGGDYHYHFPPSCLLNQVTTSNPTSDGHSPQIGWSFDGFPIYGPLGSGGNAMSFTANGCTGDYCLDECSGQEKAIPGLDSFKYRYYLTGATSDLHSLPGNPKPSTTDYPFTIKCYKGCTWSELSTDDSKCTLGSTGVTTGYVAAVVSGYTTTYLSTASEAASMRCGSTSASPSPSASTSRSPTASPSPRASANQIPGQGWHLYRIVFKKVRQEPNIGSDSFVQLGEISFRYKDRRVDFAEARAYSAEKDGLPGVEASLAIDGNSQTKWVGSPLAPLMIEFPHPVAIDAYTFHTAGDGPDRDPVQWRLEGSSDGGVTYALLHDSTYDRDVPSLYQDDYPTPYERRKVLEWFRVPPCYGARVVDGIEQCIDSGQLIERGLLPHGTPL